MKITALTPQKNKNRVNVFLDGEFARGLQRDTVVDAGLKAGDECSAERLEQLAADSEYRKALEKAFGYLGRKMRSVSEMRTYLKSKGYEEGTVEQVTARLIDLKYLGDGNYAKLFVGEEGRHSGVKMMEYKLRQRGVSQEEIDAALSETDGQADAAKSMAEKYMRHKERTRENRQKLVRYLAGRGFLYEDAVSAAKSVFEGGDEEGGDEC